MCRNLREVRFQPQDLADSINKGALMMRSGAAHKRAVYIEKNKRSGGQTEWMTGCGGEQVPGTSRFAV